MRLRAVSLLVILAACGDPESRVRPSAAAGDAAPSRPDAPALAIVPAATHDFRLTALEPAELGALRTCDVAYVAPIVVGAPADVRCAAGPFGSQITVTPAEAVAHLPRRAQIEVRVERAGEHVAAETTFVRVTGQLAEPETPSRCLCREPEPPGERAPEGFDFSRFERQRAKLWGTRQICVISLVTELARSSRTAREFSAGRVFDPETLPYAARLYCAWPGGSGAVFVGAYSAYELLRLGPGQAVAIELGWAPTAGYPTGRLDGIVYRPR